MFLFCALQNILVVADMSIGSSVWREREEGEGRGKKSFAGRRGVEVINFFWESRYIFMLKDRREELIICSKPIVSAGSLL